MLVKKGTFCFLVVILLVKYTEQYSDGAPPDACQDQIPQHDNFLRQSTAAPYSILLSADQVYPGDEVTVVLISSEEQRIPIRGFQLQARELENPDRTVGEFVDPPVSSRVRYESCSSTHDTATHTSPEEKLALTFIWQAPSDFLGGVVFRATVARDYETFWTGVESNVLEVIA